MICANGHVNGMFEDIESNGQVCYTCMFCGDIAYTNERLHISPGNPVMYNSSGYGPIEEPDYFEPNQFTPGHSNPRKYTESQIEQMEHMHEDGMTIGDIAGAFGITQGAAWGVLRRKRLNSNRFSPTANDIVVMEEIL